MGYVCVRRVSVFQWCWGVVDFNPICASVWEGGVVLCLCVS